MPDKGADSNVQAFLRREEELNKAKKFCADTRTVSLNTEFSNKGIKKVAAAARARQAAAAAEEMASLDTELLASRRARLKILYAEQAAGYQKELAEMGLSLSW